MKFPHVERQLYLSICENFNNGNILKFNLINQKILLIIKLNGDLYFNIFIQKWHFLCCVKLAESLIIYLLLNFVSGFMLFLHFEYMSFQFKYFKYKYSRLFVPFSCFTSLFICLQNQNIFRFRFWSMPMQWLDNLVCNIFLFLTS